MKAVLHISCTRTFVADSALKVHVIIASSVTIIIRVSGVQVPFPPPIFLGESRPSGFWLAKNTVAFFSISLA